MEDDENWRSELDIGGLSLIDEDDSLLLSSFLDPTSYEFSDTDKDDRGLCLFGDTHNGDEEIRVATLEGKEDVLQRHQSSEPHNMTKNGKCNLRKSLAWDKAFFTSAGVLEPDELSSMIESNHMGEKKILPTIQEDVNRSTESISTLQSDCNDKTCQEFALSSDAVTPGKTKELGATETAFSPTPSMPDNPDSQEKMKRNESLKTPSIRVQRLGKMTKQPVAAKEHNTSISRPPSGLSRTKRALVDVNKAKEKNSISTRGKEPLAPRTPISRSSRSIVSKPVVPLKSSLRSSVVSKSELTSSCSSLESCASVSSSASNKSSLDSVKQKKDQSLRIASHSLANGSASRNRVQPKVPPVSASRTYKSKLFSNVSSANWSSSRSVDWSSRTWQASTPNKMGNGNQKTVPGERGPAVDDKKQTLKLVNNSKDVSVVQDDPKPGKRGAVVNGSAVRSASVMKPTGLRVPSPKIGYFDGAKTSVARTCTGPVSRLAKDGGRSPNEPTASRSKSQPTRSPLIQESTNCKAKVSPVSRLMVSASASSPKLTNKRYSKVSAEEQLKGNQ